MKQKLNKFNQFSAGILPLETDFLCYFQKFEDPEKSSILNNIVYQANNPDQNFTFDSSIDLRKYSYVKKWCEDILSNLDVDNNLGKLIEWEQLMLTDRISTTDEKALLKWISKAVSSDFNFLKIYDIARIYRHYLQIRLRHKDYKTVHDFLNKYRTDYEFSKLVNDKLHETTNEIIADYNQKNRATYSESIPWLSSLFYNDSLDGYNRILAWIRMVFIAHNMRRYDLLTVMFDHFERQVASGKWYSRRIIANFYSQYLLYYSARNDMNKAIYYGYLSIKIKNDDFVYYINNLAAVLLRAHRAQEALEVLREAIEEAKITQNMHNKIGHAAYRIFGLCDIGKSKQAENQAFVFFTAYKKEIRHHRWHLFFTAYLKAMLLNHNFHDVIKLNIHQKLIERDTQSLEASNYSPAIPWMVALAQYKTELITLQELDTKLNSFLHLKPEYHNTTTTIHDLIELTKIVLKEVFYKLNILKFNYT